MCNLSQGIVDDTKVEVITAVVLNMYENKFSLEQIALATKKSIAEVEAIIKKRVCISIRVYRHYYESERQIRDGLLLF